MNGKEKANDLSVAIRLGFYTNKSKAYVMVQHGFPLDVIEVATTKNDLKKKIFVIALKEKSFNQWANDIKNKANK